MINRSQLKAKPKITYTFDAFGNTLKQKGSREINPYTFSTKEQDKSGLVYFGARYYNPRVGRWISKDLIPAPNLYLYCKNNPINLIDPFGLDTYYINRNLFVNTAEPTESRISHSFVATTDNGRVTDTYSWGNDSRSQWFHNDPLDMAAAQKAIDSRIGMDWEGGEDLDQFVVIEFNKRKNNTTPYNLFTNNCKLNADALIKDASKQQKKKGKIK